MYFLEGPEDIEDEGWDYILEEFIEDIKESFIDKYENEDENYIKIEDMEIFVGYLRNKILKTQNT